MSSRIILVGGSWGALRAVRCVLEPLGADSTPAWSSCSTAWPVRSVMGWPSSCRVRPRCP